MKQYVFLRTAWMKEYRGVTSNDKPIGAGSYYKTYTSGAEVFNFLPIGNNYYGYIWIQNGRTLELRKLGAEKGDTYIDNITVVLFSKNPITGIQCIVGWYQNARIYKTPQKIKARELKKEKDFTILASVNKSRLLPPEERHFTVSGPGQTNVWYPGLHKGKAFFDKLELYIQNPELLSKTRKKPLKGSWKPDVENKRKVEYAAMEMVEQYYTDEGFKVEYRHKENLGWDLEAINGSTKLLLEIKGLSADFLSAELTANEYKNSKLKQSSYRICVVSNALNKNKKLDIYYWNGKNWINQDNVTIGVKEITSARFYKN